MQEMMWYLGWGFLSIGVGCYILEFILTFKATKFGAAITHLKLCLIAPLCIIVAIIFASIWEHLDYGDGFIAAAGFFVALLMLYNAWYTLTKLKLTKELLSLSPELEDAFYYLDIEANDQRQKTHSAITQLKRAITAEAKSLNRPKKLKLMNVCLKELKDRLPYYNID